MNISHKKTVTIVGGGLAGVEAAARLARAGVETELFEMKPERFSPAHKSADLAELVCSNSFRSDEPNSAVGLLKEEMRRLGSVLMAAAEKTRTPAGKALAVDRDLFAREATRTVESLPGVSIVRREFTELDPDRLIVLAAGPLASEDLSRNLAGLIGEDSLHFYDAIAPIVAADSVDMSKAFWGSRYGEAGQGDYLNCPMNQDQYEAFYQALLEADETPARDFEDPVFFEGCLPVEIMARRGPLTLTFGPLKPVGFTDPATGSRPYALVQLRRENEAGTLFNMVGFQTRLRLPDQERVFRMIPGLERAEFARYGSVHRNTFINAPRHLDRFLRLRRHPNLFLAGQISGVEGYVESAAMGILAGENAARQALGRDLLSPPPTTAMGALVSHLTDQTPRNFQPSNVNFGLTPPPQGKIPKKKRREFYSARALQDLEAWISGTDYEP